MSRATNGIYTLPNTVNPVVPGTTIEAVWANTTLDDVATAVTDSLDRNGRGSMSAPLKLANGTVAAPGLTFAAETTLGFYRISAGVMGITVAGVEVGRFTATGLSLPSVMFADGTVMGSAKQLGMRNKLINGNFGINQRGVSGTVVLAAGAYGHDRFKAGASGCTYTFAPSANVTTLTISAGSLQQVVEGINLQSGTHVLSWSGTAQGRIDGGTYGASGTVTATAGGGTNMTVEFNTGTVSLAQLEEGSLASLFEHRPFPVERQICEWYYRVIQASVSTGWTNTLPSENLLNGVMRTTPTIGTVTFNSGTGATFNAVTDRLVTQVSAHSTNQALATIPLSAEL